MKVEYLKVQNFLCVGEEPLEIDFTQLGKIVMIQGQNLDFHSDDDSSGLEGDEYHSNGSGKSGSLSEGLIYGLYGNTIRKKVTHTDVIHNKTKKKLNVEVIFSINNIRYRIVRTRKPDSLRLWQDGPPWNDDNEITRGGQPATQKQIEDILGMTHKAMVNVVCFGQHNDYNFLEVPTAEQRAIAESLLSLEVFKGYCATTKDIIKDHKTNLKEMSTVYEVVKNQHTNCQKRVEQIQQQQQEWETKTQNDITSLDKELKDIKTSLAKTDIGSLLLEYEKSQTELSHIKELLPTRQEQEQSLEKGLQQAKDHYDSLKEKLHQLNLTKSSAGQELANHLHDKAKHESDIQKLDTLPEGAKCPHCYGTIDKQHYKHVIKLHKNKLESLVPKIEAVLARIDATKLEISKLQQSISKIEQLKIDAQTKLNNLTNEIKKLKSRSNEISKLQRPDLTSTELLLKQKLEQVEEDITNKKTGLMEGGPYLQIMATAKSDLEKSAEKIEDQKKQMAVVEEILPYYEWWSKGFGDDGIRAYVISTIVPALNTRIKHWMQYLTNGMLTVTFDKYLNATIESNNGDPYAYFATCGGERKRINLAISQAFAHVMTLSSGTWPSLVFLDEVSDSIDQRGIRSIYNMICELSKEKQVFVITHNIHLRDMLEGADTINLVRQNGCTKRVI